MILTSDYAKSGAARAVPGAYYDKEKRAWVMSDPTPRAAAVAMRLFPTLSTQYPELNELRAQLGQNVRPINYAEEYGRAIGAERVREQLAGEGKAFYRFQEIDLGYLADVLVHHGGAYLGWERGLGKTLATCAILDELDCRRSLVVCPNTAKQSVWADELARWCPWLEVVVLPNEKRKRESALSYIKTAAAVPFVLVVHYEALSIIADERTGGRGWDRYGTWDIVVADEAHRISNPKAKMSRALKRIPAKSKLALSGSIIQNHAEDLFSPLNWLFPNRYKSKWRDWNDRYLDFVDSGWSRVCVGVKVEKLDELRDELGRFMCYRRKEDCLDLPKRTEETRFIELSPAQRRAYDELVESSVAELEDGTVVSATDAIVLLGRLRQVATGLDLVSGELVDSSKLDLAIDLITDNPDAAFVVFSWYKAAAYSMASRLEALGIGHYVVTGDTPHDTRARYIQEFQEGSGQVFIGTLSTLGESVTLHRASNAIFLDRSWNPATNDQAADRIYRIGQKNPVTITHLVARGTVDELRVLPVIQDKSALRELILGG
jgi:SNF2 family DNA or RNA helicase